MSTQNIPYSDLGPHCLLRPVSPNTQGVSSRTDLVGTQWNPLNICLGAK